MCKIPGSGSLLCFGTQALTITAARSQPRHCPAHLSHSQTPLSSRLQPHPIRLAKCTMSTVVSASLHEDPTHPLCQASPAVGLGWTAPGLDRINCPSPPPAILGRVSIPCSPSPHCTGSGQHPSAYNGSPKLPTWPSSPNNCPPPT